MEYTQAKQRCLSNLASLERNLEPTGRTLHHCQYVTLPIFMIFINLLVVSIQVFPLSSRSDTEPWILYVAMQSKGILTVSFDLSKPSSMSLQIIDVNTDGRFMPGWLTTHNDKKYSASRTDYPSNSSVNGGSLCLPKALRTRRTKSGS
jgi:hypothetical protein